MWFLYPAAIALIWQTFSKHRTPIGHGQQWRQPTALRNMPFFRAGPAESATPYFVDPHVRKVWQPGWQGPMAAGYWRNQHGRDMEWHPNDIKRSAVAGYPGAIVESGGGNTKYPDASTVQWGFDPSWRQTGPNREW